jgi:hypothetical protein
VKILEYVGLDTSRVKAQYAKVRAAIERDDFRQADVRKLANLSHRKFFRAKLDDDKIPTVDAANAAADAAPARYVHPDRRDIHLLDKAISFDDAQETAYRLPPPLIRERAGPGFDFEHAGDRNFWATVVQAAMVRTSDGSLLRNR